MYKLIPFILAAIISLSSLSSCRKVYDNIHQHPDVHDTLCRVTQLIYADNPMGDGLRINITYNAKGDPVLLSQSQLSHLLTSELRFRYDKYGRLTDYLYGTGLPPEDSGRIYSPFLWHKYAYPAPDIVADTFITYPTTLYNQPSPIAPPNTAVFLYKFDGEGKMIAIAESSKIPHPPKPVFSPIPYDARGNKDYGPDSRIVYDSAINVYRTNKVWQLVFGDYSRNNPIYKTSLPTPVNAYGLPTRLPYLYAEPLPTFEYISYYLPYYYIEYACSAPKGPINY